MSKRSIIKAGKHERIRKLLNNLCAHDSWLPTDLPLVLDHGPSPAESLEIRQPVRSVDGPEAAMGDGHTR